MLDLEAAVARENALAMYVTCMIMMFFIIGDSRLVMVVKMMERIIMSIEDGVGRDMRNEQRNTKRVFDTKPPRSA